MNFGIVIKILGSLLLIEGACMVLPFAVSVLYGENDWWAFLICIILNALVGYLMYYFGGHLHILKNSKNGSGATENGNGKRSVIKVKESLAIVSSGWVLVCLFGCLPFIITGSIPHFVDAFFEVVSGFTTTGATILNDIEVMFHGILFWRSFTHWIGGMGILVFTVALLPALGIGSFQLYKAEIPGPIADRLVPRIKDTARVLYITYIIMTMVQIVLLVIGRMPLFDSIIHTFGTVGTGGLSIKNTSIGAYNSTYINLVISVFMVLASTNFSLYYAIYRGRWKEALKNQELRFYYGTITISTILIALSINREFFSNIWNSLEHAFFQVSSIISTTGYTSVDFDQWPTFGKTILFVLMFIGGCAGSTAGGIKGIRIIALAKLVRRETQKIIHPRAVIPVKLGDRTLQTDTIYSIFSFVFLYILIFIAGTLGLSLEGISITSAASAAIATLGNIGPGFEFVGPMRNYSEFTDFSKLLMSVLMLLGRLELFTIIILFNRKLWTNEM